MVLRFDLDHCKGSGRRAGAVHEVILRPLPTAAIGMFGGVIVGMTSVGSGSLIIVLLLFVYPLIGANQLVVPTFPGGPITSAAALGALAFGHVELSVTASVIIGSVPAVVVGSFLSSRLPDRNIRPVITFVIFASGLKYAGVGTNALGWILCAVLLGAPAIWLAYVRPWHDAPPATLHGSWRRTRRVSWTRSVPMTTTRSRIRSGILDLGYGTSTHVKDCPSTT